jgi:hypothetical protein
MVSKYQYIVFVAACGVSLCVLLTTESVNAQNPIIGGPGGKCVYGVEVMTSSGEARKTLNRFPTVEACESSRHDMERAFLDVINQVNHGLQQLGSFQYLETGCSPGNESGQQKAFCDAKRVTEHSLRTLTSCSCSGTPPDPAGKYSSLSQGRSDTSNRSDQLSDDASIEALDAYASSMENSIARVEEAREHANSRNRENKSAISRQFDQLRDGDDARRAKGTGELQWYSEKSSETSDERVSDRPTEALERDRITSMRENYSNSASTAQHHGKDPTRQNISEGVEATGDFSQREPLPKSLTGNSISDDSFYRDLSKEAWVSNGSLKAEFFEHPCLAGELFVSENRVAKAGGTFYDYYRTPSGLDCNETIWVVEIEEECASHQCPTREWVERPFGIRDRSKCKRYYHWSGSRAVLEQWIAENEERVESRHKEKRDLVPDGKCFDGLYRVFGVPTKHRKVGALVESVADSGYISTSKSDPKRLSHQRIPDHPSDDTNSRERLTEDADDELSQLEEPHGGDETERAEETGELRWHSEESLETSDERVPRALTEAVERGREWLIKKLNPLQYVPEEFKITSSKGIVLFEIGNRNLGAVDRVSRLIRSVKEDGINDYCSPYSIDSLGLSYWANEDTNKC